MNVKQFVSTTNDEIRMLREGIHEEGTKKSTLWGVKLFIGK